MIIATGKVTSVIWSKPEESFYIFELQTKKKKVKVVAYSPFSIVPGTQLEVSGQFEESKYGPQLRAQSIIEKPPEEDFLAEYLRQKITMLGNVLSRRVVEKFRADTIRVLNEEPHRLMEVEGISHGRFKEIIQAWKETEQNRSTTLFLMKLGLLNRQIASVKKRFVHVDDLETLLRGNPYLLLQVDGIGIGTADDAFFTTGGKAGDSKRIFALIQAALEEAKNSMGHVFLSKNELVFWVERLIKSFRLKPVSGQIDVVLYAHLKNLPEGGEVVLDEDRLYLKGMLFVERECAERLCSRRFKTVLPPEFPLSRFIEEYEKDHKIIFSAGQREFLEQFFDNSIHILTGLPGTGKTTIVKALVELLETTGLSYALCAPTGMAAKRVEQLSGRPSYTLHRYLGATGEQWLYNEENPRNEAVVIVDEMSMVDLNLFFRLLDGTSRETRYIFIGDTEQLPPVGAGLVLRDLIDSQLFHTIKLSRIFRQEETSLIVENAHRISAGEPLVFSKEKGFVAFNVTGPIFDQLLTKLVDKVAAAGKNVMCLAAVHRGQYGVSRINSLLQEHCNPPESRKQEVDVGKVKFREGDKVVICKNNYKKNVVNGDLGKVIWVDVTDKKLTVEVADVGLVVYDFGELNELKLAYCLSVHKSQGSQADGVVVVVVPEHEYMLTRKLFYTAVTRARTTVLVLGDPTGIIKAIRNIREDKRNTFLVFRLRQVARVE